MATYNFSQISDFEFESLCRDLLQAELGHSLELFAPGPDGGIDIRYIGEVGGEGHTIVAQCKRWDENSFNNLLRHLSRVELPKVQELAPNRYIVMTSVGLTPARKNRIVEALDPWVKIPSDVIGRDDLSGLLAKHQDVEHRHVKLWLTSTEVLDALLNSGIARRSEDAVERAQRQLRVWVPNPSFNRARETLEANHVCVISGAPGIGKTMLGDVLMAGYAAQGYQQVAISDDIEEGDSAWRTNRPQIFLYDDFLGQVTYGELHLKKNEQSRLARFLERVRDSENKRLILTTREYILAEAMHRYERLSDRKIAPLKSIVSLEDYTNAIRGRILYNHLFFSNLPSTLKTALLPGKRYWDVIRHPNYSPRIIEHAVDLPDVATLNRDDFVSNIFATLDDPTRVWGRIFDNLPDMARRVLLVLASLPTYVFLGDVRDAVKSLWPTNFDAGKFTNAVGMIEGTFIDLREAKPGQASSERLISIRNPSVRDYLWSRLETIEGEAEILLEGSIFFEQCVVLYQGQNHVNSNLPASFRRTASVARKRMVVNHERVASRSIKLMTSPSPIVSWFRNEDSTYAERERMNLERRAEFLMTLLAEHSTNRSIGPSALVALETVVTEWESGRGSTSDGVRTIDRSITAREFLPEDTFERAERALFSLITERLNQTQDFEALVELANLSTHLFDCPNRSLESWCTEFEDFLDGERSWLLEDIDDPDWLDSEMRDIRRVADALGLDIGELERLAENRIDSLRTDWEPDIDSDMPELYSDSEEPSDEDEEEHEIDALFQSLHELSVPPC